jgi:hypothetical protein
MSVSNTSGYLGIQNPRVWMTYLSPSIQSTLPARSISTLCNLQYFQQQSTPSGYTAVGDTPNGTPFNQPVFTFSAVTFSNIPDLIMISIRPVSTSMRSTEADWQCTYPDNAFQQFTFANQSGLFSGFTANSLIQMSRNNGSRSSLSQYGGTDGAGVMTLNGRPCTAGGAPLLIRPGVDFPLPPGTSVGSTGQVQLAFQLRFNAPGTNSDAPRAFVCTVTAISSGYFVTDNGVSRQLLVGLDEETVLKAPEAPNRFMAQRLTGGSLASHLGLSASHGSGAFDDMVKKATGAGARSFGDLQGRGIAGGGVAPSSGYASSYLGKRSLAERLAD